MILKFISKLYQIIPFELNLRKENWLIASIYKGFFQKPFLPDSCNTNNKNDNPNINILMSENIRQKRYSDYRFYYLQGFIPGKRIFYLVLRIVLNSV